MPRRMRGSTAEVSEGNAPEKSLEQQDAARGRRPRLLPPRAGLVHEPVRKTRSRTS